MSLEVKILEHFNKASAHLMSTGLHWYERAHNECLLLAQVFELPVSIVIGVVSAFSPRNKWHRNLYDAWNFLDNPSLDTKVSTFIGQRKKALAILASNGDEATIHTILGGEKTQNFFNNILYYKESQSVTVDIWAFRSVDLKPSIKNFKATEQAYVNVAKQLNLKPHQVQAVVWGVVRGKSA